MTSTDAYSEWDAAYVLGGLSPAQRREFEEHLATCPSCQEAVAELAGMPGLLAQVPVGEVLAMDLPASEAPPPASLMPVLPPPPEARRRRWLAPVAAVAAALVVGVGGGYAVSNGSRTPAPTPTVTVQAVPVPGRLAFSAVEPSSMTAVVDVAPAANGTALRVECQYAVGPATSGEPDYQGAWAEYAIWVVDKSGKATQIKSWTARPDKVMHPSAVAAVPVSQLAAVEIRRVDTGRTVMRASLI